MRLCVCVCVCVAGRMAGGGRRGYSIRCRQCVRKLPGNTWAWCRDKCTLAFAYFSPARFPYPPERRSILRSDPICTCPPSPASLAISFLLSLLLFRVYLVSFIRYRNIGWTQSKVRTAIFADKCRCHRCRALYFAKIIYKDLVHYTNVSSRDSHFSGTSIACSLRI